MNTHLNGRRRAAVAAGVVLTALAGTACGDGSTSGAASSSTTTAEASSTTLVEAAPVIDPGDGGRYDPKIDPADFVDTVDNPYFPLAVGSTWVYEGMSEGEVERIEIEVLDERKEIMGISATVVRDIVYIADEVVEDTLDWYAQDRDGNVWYLGESVKDYENGEVVSTDGSFEVGVDGALPGIVMLAEPTVGDAYRQEFYAGEAEDLGEILRVDAEKEVAFGSYDEVVVTEDWNPLDPEPIEEKYYAPGVGLIFETHTRGPAGSVELQDFSPGA